MSKVVLLDLMTVTLNLVKLELIANFGSVHVWKAPPGNTASELGGGFLFTLCLPNC